MRRVAFIFSVLFILNKISFSQLIDYYSTFKSHSNKLFRLHFDNDYFTKTDRYYTNGITLEFLHPVLKKSPLNCLLIKSTLSEYKYGLVFSIFCYTPTSVTTQNILYGDRPFCGNITLSSFISSKDTLKQRLITSVMTVGIIGQGAGGKETQTGIHRLLNNILPEGWDNQIRNDVILNYKLNYEKKLLWAGNHFLLNACGEINAGTHSDNIKAGINFMTGKFIDPYESKVKLTKKINWYFYARCQTALIIYDATLQGGLFDKKSPYTIPSAEINRFTLQSDYGLVMIFKKIYLEYCQSFLTKEFNTGKNHRWGGIRIGVGL